MSSLILVCAATSVEAKACRQGIGKSGQSARYEILQTGMGLAHAGKSLEKRLMDSQLPRPSLVISTGFAGSWTRELAVGDWISGKSIETEKAVFKFDLNPISQNLSFRVQASRVISLLKASSQDKVHLKTDSDLPVVIDMESHALAEVCQGANIPFQIIRLISDNPDAPLPESVGSFASVFTAPSMPDKLQSLAAGLGQAFREPKRLAGFIARGTKLPGLLSKGWQEIAFHHE